MTNFLQRIGMFIFHIKPSRELMYNVDEELIKKDSIISAQARKLASQDAQLSKISAKESSKKEKQNQEELENEVAVKLSEEENNLNVEKFGKWISWTKAEKEISKNKRFLVSDKNGESTWSYGGLLFSTKGYMAVRDAKTKKLLNISRTLNGLFHKPESLINNFKIGRILLARDKDGDYLDEFDSEGDIDDFETNISSFNQETKQLEKTTELKINARKRIIQQDEEIRDLKDKLKTVEFSLNDMRIRYEDVKRARDRLLYANKLGKTAVSTAQNESYYYSMEFADISRRISNLQEGRVLDSNIIAVKDKIIEKLLKEIGDSGDQDALKRSMGWMREMREFERANPPIVIKEEPKAQKLNSPAQTPK